jgi:MFS family permease
MKTEPSQDSVIDPTVTATGTTPLEEKLPSQLSVLRNRNYALLFWGQLISAAGTQMQIVAVAWQVYLLTHSAIALGLIGLVQAVPSLVFSLVGGVFADVFDRRKLLLFIEVTMALMSAVLALCTFFNVINMYIIYIVVLISACVSAFEFPTRQAIIPTLVPRSQLINAVSLRVLPPSPYVVLSQLRHIVPLSAYPANKKNVGHLLVWS